MRPDDLHGFHAAHEKDGRKVARFFRGLWRTIRRPLKAMLLLVFIGLGAKVATFYGGGTFETNAVIIALVWILSDIDTINGRLVFLENDDE
jgi:hypothetical protein